MDKKEKYYHHVIKDMIRKTSYTIDYQNEGNVRLVFPMHNIDDEFVFRKDYIDLHTWSTTSKEDEKFLSHTYGIKDSECVMIMTRYWETLKPLLHSLWDY